MSVSLHRKLAIVVLILAFAGVVALEAFAREDNGKGKGKEKGKGLGVVKIDEDDIEALDLPSIEDAKDLPQMLVVGPKGKAKMIRAEVPALALASSTPPPPPPANGTSTDNSTSTASSTMPLPPPPPVTITLLTVKIWGISLMVDISSARRVPEGVEFKVGDKVNVLGSIDAVTGKITAKRIHNVTGRNRHNEDLLVKIRELLKKLNELQRKAGLPETQI